MRYLILIYLVPELIEFGLEHHPETMIEKPEWSRIAYTQGEIVLPIAKSALF